MFQIQNTEEEEVLLRLSNVAKEYINLGLEIWSKSPSNAEILKTELAPSLLFRHILEMSDGISELIKAGCINASVPLMRSLLEVYFQLSFMLMEDTNRKALQFLYHNEICRKEYYERLVSDSNPNSLFQKVKGDKYLKGKNIFNDKSEYYKGRIQVINEVLNSDDYKDIAYEYNKIPVNPQTGKTRKIKYWYQLFDGPMSVEQIAIRISQQAFYEVYYREMSSYSHAENIVHPNLEVLDEQNMGISLLRDLRQLNTVFSNYCVLIKGSILIFLKQTQLDKKLYAEKLLAIINKGNEILKS